MDKLNKYHLISILFAGILILGIFSLTWYVGEKGGVGNETTNQNASQEEATPTPKEVVLNSIDKMKGIESCKVEYNGTYGMKTGAKSISYGMGKEVKASGEKSRVDVAFQEEETRNYYLPAGKYTCSEGYSGWTCYESEQEENILNRKKDLKQLIEDGGLTFTNGTVETREITGRNCHYVEMNINPEKAQSVLGTMPSQSYDINSVSINTCYDKENGLSLLQEWDIKMSSAGETGTMSISLEVEEVKTGLEFPSGTFELPAEVTTSGSSSSSSSGGSTTYEYNSTVSDTSPAELEVVESDIQVDVNEYMSTAEVTGTVENIGDAEVGSGTVKAKFFDKDNVQLGTGSSYVYDLDPGTKASFTITSYPDNADEIDHYELETEVNY